MQLVLAHGVEAERIIFSHPCKMKSDLRFSREHGITKTVFDNAAELYKIEQIYPHAELFLRIYASDATAKTDLSVKFGASLKSAKHLLHVAKKLNLAVVGISFHVGSGGFDPVALETAISEAREVFDYASGLGFAMSFLDIGGGFTTDTFPSIGPSVKRSLDKHFSEGVNILAEPGRYFAAGAMTLACNVIGQRDIDESPSEPLSYKLYLNDGIYGNFMRYVFEQPSPTPCILYTNGEFFPPKKCGLHEPEAKAYKIWGPTCDGWDCINEEVQLNKVIKIGDWLYYENMGG